jgi:hypothetical protein
MPTYKNCVGMAPIAKLWHYTSLAAITAILKDQKLRLRRIDTYWEDDPFEGSVPKKQMDEQGMILGSQTEALMQTVAPHYFPDMDVPRRPARNRSDEITKWREGMARSCHVSCWSAAGESDVMWRLYCADERKGCGVALQSTFGQIEASATHHDLIVGQIRYRRYDDGGAFDDNLDPFFCKRSNYEIETELRVLKFNEDHYNQIVTAITSDSATPVELDKYIYVDWSPAEVINQIWISPYADEGYAEKVREAITQQSLI